MVLYGSTSDGDEVESNRFILPITICNGCRTACQSNPPPTGSIACSDLGLGADRSFCLDPDC